VCGFIITREEPPKGCPKCGSSSAEFLLMKPYEQFTYDGEKFDILLINGSPHRANNTGYLLDRAEDALRSKGVSYRRYNLNEYTLDQCWCCYSMKAEFCTYPCRNAEDDMPAFHKLLAASKAVIVGARSTGTPCQPGSRSSSTGPPVCRISSISKNPG
jgi:hypothetical protein